MKKVFSLFSVVLMVLFSNYQVYAQVFCQESKCFGCCPSESSGFSSCKCDVGKNDTDDHKKGVSAVTVSKVIVRFYYSSIVLHSYVLDLINSGAVEFQKLKTDNSTSSLTMSSFQIPLRI